MRRRHELYAQVIQIWMDRRSSDAQTFDGSPLEHALSRFALEQFSDGTYYTIDRGIKDGDYYYMAPYATVCPIAAGAHPDVRRHTGQRHRPR